MSALVSDGYISRKPGVSSTVVTRKAQVNLTSFVNPDSATAGHPGAHEVIHSAVVSAAEAGTDLPELRADEPVIVLLRRKLDVTGSPMSIERHALPFAVAPKLLDEDLDTLVSMRYLRKLGVSIVSIRLYLIPCTLAQKDAELLDASSGEVTLIRRRELLDQDGRIQEVVETIVRPGSADFYVEVPGPDRGSGCTSPIGIHLGNVGPTRTPTGGCVSTSRRRPA